MYGNFTRVPLYKEREAIKQKTVYDKYIGNKFPLHLKGGTLISYGQIGREKSTLKQYREQSPKGKYFYRSMKGITAFYKRPMR